MFEVDAAMYERHMGRYSPQLAAGLCELAAIDRGVRALDVGSRPFDLTARAWAVAGSV